MFNSFNTKTLRRALAGASLALAAVAAFANTSVAGTWAMSVDTPAGSGNPSFVLKQDGDKVSGTYNGAFGSAAVTGTVKGDVLTKSYTSSGGAVVTYTGKVSGNKIEGAADFGQIGKGTFSGTKQ